jgi:hypothetical protein
MVLVKLLARALDVKRPAAKSAAIHVFIFPPIANLDDMPPLGRHVAPGAKFPDIARERNLALGGLSSAPNAISAFGFRRRGDRIAFMEHRVINAFTRADGCRRVLIVEGDDRLFRFIERVRQDIAADFPFDGDRERWASLGSDGTICDTAATAEREARAAIDWLREP